MWRAARDGGRRGAWRGARGRAACGGTGGGASSAAADEVDDFDLGAGPKLCFRPKKILYYQAVQFDRDAIAGNGENRQKASNSSASGHLEGFAVDNNFHHFCSGRGVGSQILAKP